MTTRYRDRPLITVPPSIVLGVLHQSRLNCVTSKETCSALLSGVILHSS